MDLHRAATRVAHRTAWVAEGHTDGTLHGPRSVTAHAEVGSPHESVLIARNAVEVHIVLLIRTCK